MARPESSVYDAQCVIVCHMPLLWSSLLAGGRENYKKSIGMLACRVLSASTGCEPGIWVLEFHVDMNLDLMLESGYVREPWP